VSHRTVLVGLLPIARRQSVRRVNGGGGRRALETIWTGGQWSDNERYWFQKNSS
jgi:hypothetical protein